MRSIVARSRSQGEDPSACRVRSPPPRLGWRQGVGRRGEPHDDHRRRSAKRSDRRVSDRGCSGRAEPGEPRSTRDDAVSRGRRGGQHHRRPVPARGRDDRPPGRPLRPRGLDVRGGAPRRAPRLRPGCPGRRTLRRQPVRQRRARERPLLRVQPSDHAGRRRDRHAVRLRPRDGEPHDRAELGPRPSGRAGRGGPRAAPRGERAGAFERPTRALRRAGESRPAKPAHRPDGPARARRRRARRR